jgi:hypothetical protein
MHSTAAGTLCQFGLLQDVTIQAQVRPQNIQLLSLVGASTLIRLYNLQNPSTAPMYHKLLVMSLKYSMGQSRRGGTYSL